MLDQPAVGPFDLIVVDRVFDERLGRVVARLLDEAERLWRAVDRRNLMIKIPGTPEGLPAIEEALYRGVNINVTLLFSVPGAYAVARLRFKGRAAFSRSILLIYMVPMIVLALPIYIAFSMTGLRNSILGIVMIYPVTTIPVALYMLQGYFRGLPAEVEEAGLMDGLNRLQVIWKITLPLSLPALASVALYVFMIAWNEFLFALTFTLTDTQRTVPVAIALISGGSQYELPWGNIMAASVIVTVPVVVLVLVFQRRIVSGLTAGALKG